MNARLLRAYRSTFYSAAGVPVRVGRRSVTMDRLLASHGARTGVLITAGNPMSRRMARGWNERMQRALTDRLRGMVVHPAQGVWRGWREEHVLVLGDVARVGRLARVFRQHAIVAVGIDRPARLVMLSGAH